MTVSGSILLLKKINSIKKKSLNESTDEMQTYKY